MSKAFTLIELLIVLVIMVLVMGVVVPQGAKMLDRYNKYFDKVQAKQKLSQSKAYAFLTLKEQYNSIEDVNYTTNIKGIIIEKSYDNY